MALIIQLLEQEEQALELLVRVKTLMMLMLTKEAIYPNMEAT